MEIRSVTFFVNGTIAYMNKDVMPLFFFLSVFFFPLRMLFSIIPLHECPEKWKCEWLDWHVICLVLIYLQCLLGLWWWGSRYLECHQGPSEHPDRARPYQPQHHHWLWPGKPQGFPELGRGHHMGRCCSPRSSLWLGWGTHEYIKILLVVQLFKML